MTDEEALERLATEETASVDEAVELIGVPAKTIRQWQFRGYLEPVPGFLEVRFFRGDLWVCQKVRKGRRYATELAVSASAFRAVE